MSAIFYNRADNVAVAHRSVGKESLTSNSQLRVRFRTFSCSDIKVVRMNKHTDKHFDSVGTVAIVAALVSWSMGPVSVAYLSGYMDSWTQNAARYIVAILFWLPVLIAYIARREIPRRVWLVAIIPAIINIGMQSCWASAAYHIDPGFMTLLAKSSLLWIMIFSMILFADERALLRNSRFWIGLILCIAGLVGVITFRDDFHAFGTLTGISLVLIAAFLWALYTVFVRILFTHVDSRVGFAIVSAYTTIGLLILAAYFAEPVDWVALPKRVWAAVIGSGIICIAIAHVLFFMSIKRLGATIPSLVLLLQPFAVLIISRIVFGEILGFWQLFAGVVLLCGTALAILSHRDLKDRPAGMGR